jgi:hypothetical protein
MAPVSSHSPEATRAFLESMCAQVNGQLAVQTLQWAPELAVHAQAHLDLATVLDLLRD